MKIVPCVVHNSANMRIKSRAFGISQPLGAGYLASCFLENRHQVKILDNSIKKLDCENCEESVQLFKPDVVGFTTYTFSINNCYQLA